MLVSEFSEALAYATPGTVIEYHRGHLARQCRDRAYRAKASGEQVEVIRADATPLERLRTCAMRAAEEGHVHLVQRRIADGEYAYMAVVRGSRARSSNSRRSIAAVSDTGASPEAQF